MEPSIDIVKSHDQINSMEPSNDIAESVNKIKSMEPSNDIVESVNQIKSMETSNDIADSVDQIKSMELSDDIVQSANLIKDEANSHFKKGEYEKAIELYSEAIKLNPNVAVYYGNRSFAYIKAEYFGYALEDAETCIKLDKSYIKGYYRRASAYMSLGKYRLALKDYEAVSKSRPNNADAKRKYLECNKLVKLMQFQAAISVEECRPASETVELELMEIEDSYDGPHLEDGKVTKKFMDELIPYFVNQKKLHKKYAYTILLNVKKYFEAQPTLVDVEIPAGKKFTVCGDIHGQYYDLVNIFELNGYPTEDNPYLFNGDFVDRGSFSVECIYVLLGYKLLYPDTFHMSRGNHESANMNRMYGFEGEVLTKYTKQMADVFTEVYNWLPLAHCLNNKVLVMHGGLFSDDDVTLEDIKEIKRDRQPPEEGIMCDLLWSDPQINNGRCPSKRGVGIHFGPDVTANFLEKNNLEYIIRSHEVKEDGYEITHDGKCITVFSAPNYCDTMKNKGAFITLEGPTLKPKFVTFEEVEHPPIQPMAYATDVMKLLV